MHLGGLPLLAQRGSEHALLRVARSKLRSTQRDSVQPFRIESMGDHLHDPILPHTADELLLQDPFLPYTAAELLPHFVKYDPEGENQEKYLAHWLAKIAKAQGEDDPSWLERDETS